MNRSFRRRLGTAPLQHRSHFDQTIPALSTSLRLTNRDPTGSSYLTGAQGERSWARRPPELAGVNPTMTRIVVDLPAPLGPRKPVTRPGEAVNETSSTAVNLP